MLDQYFSGHQTVPEIQEFESGEAFLEAYEPGHYDIIFFDIDVYKRQVDDIRRGDSDATVEELCRTLQKMMK